VPRRLEYGLLRDDLPERILHIHSPHTSACPHVRLQRPAYHADPRIQEADDRELAVVSRTAREQHHGRDGRGRVGDDYMSRAGPRRTDHARYARGREHQLSEHVLLRDKLRKSLGYDKLLDGLYHLLRVSAPVSDDSARQAAMLLYRQRR